MANGMGMPQQGGGQGSSADSLPTDVLLGMQAVGGALQEAGAPPELLQQLAQAMALYEGVLQAMGGGGQAPQGQQPMTPEGQPMGPQG